MKVSHLILGFTGCFFTHVLLNYLIIQGIIANQISSNVIQKYSFYEQVKASVLLPSPILLITFLVLGVFYISYIGTHQEEV